MNYVYILLCGDGSLYTGWTNNLEKRFKDHCSGKGAKYTRGRGPLKIIYFETFENKVDAMKREYVIKKLRREEKDNLIKSFKEHIDID
jgi:putative endonuclease